MKVTIKNGSMNTQDIDFTAGVPVEVSKVKAKYIKDNFENLFIFEEAVKQETKVKTKQTKE